MSYDVIVTHSNDVDVWIEVLEEAGAEVEIRGTGVKIGHDLYTADDDLIELKEVSIKLNQYKTIVLKQVVHTYTYGGGHTEVISWRRQ